MIGPKRNVALNSHYPFGLLEPLHELDDALGEAIVVTYLRNIGLYSGHRVLYRSLG